MKRIQLIVLIVFLCISGFAQKKTLTHDDYNHWNEMRYHQISKDGNLITFEINPQRGDGNLYIVNNKQNTTKKINRARRAHISSLSDFVAFTITPPFDTIRKKKLEKVKSDNMPKDTLGVWILKDAKLLKFENLIKISVPEDGSSWFAYTHSEVKEKDKKEAKDSTSTASKENKDSKKKKANLKGDNLTIFNPTLNKKHEFKNVTDFSISRNGDGILFTQETGDTLKINNLYYFNTKLEKLEEISNGKNHTFKQITISESADKIAFLQSTDTLKKHIFSLVLRDINKNSTTTVIEKLSNEDFKNYTASENGNVFFSKNGERLFFGIAPMPIQEKKDSLTADEKYHLDVWNWKDVNIQPRQKINAKKEERRTYLSVYNIKKKSIVILENEKIKDIKIYENGNAKLALAYNEEPYGNLIDSDDSYSDVYIKNTITGEQSLFLKKFNSHVSISPSQKYITYYQPKDSSWYAYNIKTKATISLTKSIKSNFYNEIIDMPMDTNPYAYPEWTKDDKAVLICDKYDIWKIDPTGKNNPINITNGYGRNKNIEFRRVNINKDITYIDENELILSAFNDNNKKSGYFSVSIRGGNPKELIYDDAEFSKRAFMKAENKNIILWTKGSFIDYPELYMSDLSFNNIKKLSDTNPQQKDYNWGSVELVNWTSGDGDNLQGMMYKPEDYDPNKKYPMLVYFYERSSNGLHSHHVPQPNWSIINLSYCVSNGYMIFVPDITYKNKVGFPGEAAYSAIVTGTLAMLNKYSSIDKDNMALQGQSWGGYQIAYLVTRTNLYKCAMAGAPVSNMTSAYGGIRWGSGMSRQFQYEHTQSRIGGTLWNSTLEYIENSPIFYAPKINTPLLIMHNDEDGAVPWYQGIELFMAMRRLNKPCWMLTYNNEDHNLMRRANRIDLSIRTMQFFDYYLKGTKEPVWMKYGVPAHKKNKMTGYELVE